MPKNRKAFLESQCAGSPAVVEAKRDATTVEVRWKDFLVQVTVPNVAFEWFVAVHRRGAEIRSDWMDHYGAEDVALETEMRDEIESFLRQILGAPLRVRGSRLESSTDEGWNVLIPFGDSIAG